MRKAFLLSVGLHLILAFCIFNIKSETQKPQLLIIEWRGLQTPSKSRTTNHSDSAITSHSLQKALRTDWNQITENTDNSTGQEMADIEMPAHGIELNLEKALQDDRELPFLWSLIRRNISYRREHALAKIEGDVHIRVRVDRDGKILRIFEESATGPTELISWTILCLMQAFSEPFLEKKLLNSRTLDLRIQYTLGRKVLASTKRNSRMVFVVEGDVYTGSDFEERNEQPKGHLENPYQQIKGEVVFYSQSTQSFADLFRDRKLSHHEDWSFYEKVKIYQEHCEKRKNRIACEKASEIYSSIGNAFMANRYKEYSEKIEN